MVRAAALAFALLVGTRPVPAYSDAERWSGATGNDLLATCDGPSPIDQAVCLGFIIGVMRRDDLVRWMTPTSAYLCDLPGGVTYMQLRLTLVAYLKANPSKLHYHGAGLVGVAMKEAFCPKK